MVVKKTYTREELVTHDHFLTEFHRFRGIMCSGKYDPDQKFNAYEGLLVTYFLCKAGTAAEAELRTAAIDMLQAEFPMRMSLQLTARLEKLFEEMKEDI